MIFDLTTRLNTIDASNNLGKDKNFNQKFKSNIIVETHSEYMIRMMQYLVAKNEGSDTHVGIINFGSEEKLGKIKQIKIKPNGALTENFYSGFFNYSENLRLMIDALNYQRNN
jgi:predicted ATPase